MENKPEQPTVGEVTSDVEEAASAVEEVAAKPKKVAAKKGTAKKAPVKRKKPTARSKRPKKAAEPVAKKEPLTADEIRETLTDVKTQIVAVGLEPAREAFSSWSETVRGAVGGFMSGLLGEKEKKK
tara:strand:+ start:613 stop:990 length:378 start_codon:yes stop_codon:yes gene_type:complete